MTTTAETDDWRDIDTAPRDSSNLELKLSNGSIERGFWRDDTSWNMEGDYTLFDHEIDGWREIKRQR
ncbi:MAG: hypothetical protein ABJN42_03595 [Roseibium sp.]|uniref:hypothetical protein n=1 Tax=Roseibium sp. TaxID=1936156 RepID=UPI00329809AF